MNRLNSFFVSVFLLLTFLTSPYQASSSNLSDPEITISTNSISGLSYRYLEGPSHSGSFTITANDLVEDISVSPPSGFEISTDNSTFQNIPLLISKDTPEKTIFTRLKALQPINSYSGNIEISSSGASTKTISLSGEIWTKNTWNYIENFNNAALTGSYQNSTFIGNNNVTWQYTICRDEGGYGTHFMKYTKGIKLKDSNSSISSNAIPSGIGGFECKLSKGSSSTTLVEVELFVDSSLVATSEGFNDDEVHIFSVENINLSGNTTLEIRNKKSVSVIIDDISWTNYNDPESRFIQSSHDITTHIIRAADSSFYKDAAITISAKNLIDDLVITAPEHYLISGDNENFSKTLTLPLGSGDIQNKNIYIHLDSLGSKRKFIGDLTLSSNGAAPVIVKCIGATRPTTYTPLIINEVDADTKDITGTSSTDEYDFIELYTGQPGVKDLSGYVLVLYNGGTNQVHKKYDLDGYTSNEQGYFVMGDTAVMIAIINNNLENKINTVLSSISVKEGVIQKGPDAVSLYYGVGGDFAADYPTTTLNLVDAMVYSLSDKKTQYPTELMVLLNEGQPYINENAYNAEVNDITYDKETNSMGRIANGEGGLRNTSSYEPCIPTPGMPNTALLDDGVPTRIYKEGNKISIYSTAHTIHISGENNGQIYIYDLKGVLHRSALKSGTNINVPIKPAIYIVKMVDNYDVQTQKVIVSSY